MVLVVLDVLPIAVVALHHHEDGELRGVLALAHLQLPPQGIVMDQVRLLALPEHLEGGEVGLDAARYQTLVVDDVVEQILVQHVLAIVDDVVEHVNVLVGVVRIAKDRGEELRHGIVVGVALIEVFGLSKQKEGREGVRVAVQLNVGYFFIIVVVVGRFKGNVEDGLFGGIAHGGSLVCFAIDGHVLITPIPRTVHRLWRPGDWTNLLRAHGSSGGTTGVAWSERSLLAL